MSPPLRVLLIQDRPSDAARIKAMLDHHFPSLAVEHVETREAYLDRLATSRFDAMLASDDVKGCEGITAFHLARERHPEVPFIYTTGLDRLGGDLHGLRALGVSGLQAGATPAELASAVRQAVQDWTQGHPDDARVLASYERLVTVVKDLSLARDMTTIMKIVRKAARQLTGADGATFVVREGQLCHYADEDAIGPLWKGQKFPMRSCVSGWAMIHQQPAVVEDIFADPRIPVTAYEPTFVRSVVMVPIRALDPIGAIGSYWATRRLPTSREIRLLQALADTTAVAIENVQVYGELEARVADRTAELEAFIYAVSHDLRAPVRHVHAHATILREDHGDKLDEECRAGLDRITATAVRMREMIDGLLNLSRMSQLPIRSRAVDLVEVSRALLEEEPTKHRRAVEFVSPPSLPLMGDATLIRIALQNLLGNAWKFTQHVEAPRIELGIIEEPGGPPVYYVRDNGIGFDPSAATKLFGVFQRFHRGEEFPGTGVGLASVKRIVQKHGGRIWATSAPGKGATFYFTLAPSSPAIELPPS